MAIVQGAWAAGRKTAPVSRESCGVVAEKYTFTIGANLAAGDIIELGILPAYHTVVDAILITDEIGTATIDVGIMSGTVGDPAQNRTSGNELFEGAADAGAVRMSKVAGFRITPVEGDRSIGLKLVGAGVTAAGQVVELLLFTKQ
jgi:hypothetical protein